MLVTNEPNALIGLTDGSPMGAGVKNMCGACWPTKYVIAAGCPNADSAGFFAAADLPHMPLCAVNVGHGRLRIPHRNIGSRC